MFFKKLLLKLGLNIKSERKDSSQNSKNKQKIKSGKSSTNIQVGGDFKLDSSELDKIIKNDK